MYYGLSLAREQLEILKPFFGVGDNILKLEWSETLPRVAKSEKPVPLS